MTITETQARHLDHSPIVIRTQWEKLFLGDPFAGFNEDVLMELSRQKFMESTSWRTWEITPSGQKALDEYRKKEGAK